MPTAICTICQTPMPGPRADWPTYPFCSTRCRKIDLGRWLGDGYAVTRVEPSDSPADEEDDGR